MQNAYWTVSFIFLFISKLLGHITTARYNFAKPQNLLGQQHIITNWWIEITNNFEPKSGHKTLLSVPDSTVGRKQHLNKK